MATRTMPVSCPGLRRCWVLRRLLVRVLQLSVKTRLAHSSCCAAIAFREMVTAGWTVELRLGQSVNIWVDARFRPALDALLTDGSVTQDARSGHLPPHRAG